MLQNKTIRIGVRLFVILALISSLMMGCSKGKQKVENADVIDLGMDGKQAVATYKEGEVTAEEFEKYLDFLSFYYYPDNEAIRDQTNWNDYLEMYVGQKVITERAKAKNLTVKADEWDQVYQATKESISSVLEKGVSYDALLNKLQLSEQDIKNQLQQMLLFSQYFYTIKSDTELKKFYDENPEYFMIASVRHLLIDNKKRSDAEAKELATELAERIRAGEDFATLANEYTDDEFGNVDQENNKLGGLYANQPVIKWVEPFKIATMTLPLNQVSDPVQTEYGYHVIRVESRELVPFEQVKEQIADQEARNAYNMFMDDELEGLIEENKLPMAKKE